MMKILSENTLVPIGTALIVIGTGAIWVTRMSVEQEAFAGRLVKIEQRVDTNNGNFQEIRERLVRIEVILSKRGRE